MDRKFSTSALRALDKAETEADALRRKLKDPALDSRERDRMRKRLAHLDEKASVELCRWWGWPTGVEQSKGGQAS